MFQSHSASFAATTNAIYSHFIVEQKIEVCFLDAQLMAPPARVDLFSLTLLIQLASYIVFQHNWKTMAYITYDTCINQLCHIYASVFNQLDTEVTRIIKLLYIQMTKCVEFVQLVIKYLLPPQVDSPYNSHISECIRSSNFTTLSTFQIGFLVIFLCMHILHYSTCLLLQAI